MSERLVVGLACEVARGGLMFGRKRPSGICRRGGVSRFDLPRMQLSIAALSVFLCEHLSAELLLSYFEIELSYIFMNSSNYYKIT